MAFTRMPTLRTLGFFAPGFALAPAVKTFCKIEELLLALDEVLCHALDLLSKEAFGVKDNNPIRVAPYDRGGLKGLSPRDTVDRLELLVGCG